MFDFIAGKNKTEYVQQTLHLGLQAFFVIFIISIMFIFLIINIKYDIIIL